MIRCRTGQPAQILADIRRLLAADVDAFLGHDLDRQRMHPLGRFRAGAEQPRSDRRPDAAKIPPPSGCGRSCPCKGTARSVCLTSFYSPTRIYWAKKNYEQQPGNLLQLLRVARELRHVLETACQAIEQLRMKRIPRRREPVVHPQPFPPRLDEPGPPQIRQMPRRLRLRHGEHAHDLAHAQFALPESARRSMLKIRSRVRSENARNI